jgi:hypothetical protein
VGNQIDFVASMQKAYQHRIVKTMNDFVEKARIFNSGFDDRVIEMQKCQCRAFLNNKHPGQNITKLYFSNETPYKSMSTG